MHGFGVPGMRKRADRIAAQFEMTSTPGQGTSIYVTAPIPPPVTWSSWPKILISYLKESCRHVTPFKVSH